MLKSTIFMLVYPISDIALEIVSDAVDCIFDRPRIIMIWMNR